MLHFLHSEVQLHKGQNNTGAKPLLLIKINDCSLRSNRSFIESTNSLEIPCLVLSSTRTVLTSGSCASLTARCVSFKKLYLKSIRVALCQLSNDGVAVPNTIGIFIFFARTIATSLAWYLNPSCCLKEASCSSSIIITLRKGIGVKIANLVPMIMSASPDLAFLQLSNRSTSVKWLCKLTNFLLGNRL